MKRSELKEFIKGEIVTTLSEASSEDVSNQKELNKELEKTAKLVNNMGLEEANISISDLGEMGYENGEKAFDMHFDKSILNNTPDTKAYAKGFVQAIVDSAGSLRLNENEDEVFNPDAKVKKTKGLAKAKEELAQLTKQMKSLARDYKEAEGEEKEKIIADLKSKTKLKKELESILDKKKI